MVRFENKKPVGAITMNLLIWLTHFTYFRSGSAIFLFC